VPRGILPLVYCGGDALNSADVASWAAADVGRGSFGEIRIRVCTAFVRKTLVFWIKVLSAAKFGVI
jgi:hypothetical protein